MQYCFDDGGRQAAGYSGRTGDCAVRAICIVTGLSYIAVYEQLSIIQRHVYIMRGQRHQPVHKGVHTHTKVFLEYMEKLGFVRRPIGGTEIFGEKIFSSGTLMVELSDHLVAVQDNVVFDTTDSSRSRSPKARRIKAIWYRTGQYPEPIGKEANNNEAILS